jgi:hypothetical protein
VFQVSLLSSQQPLAIIHWVTQLSSISAILLHKSLRVVTGLTIVSPTASASKLAGTTSSQTKDAAIETGHLLVTNIVAVRITPFVVLESCVVLELYIMLFLTGPGFGQSLFPCSSTEHTENGAISYCCGPNSSCCDTPTSIFSVPVGQITLRADQLPASTSQSSSSTSTSSLTSTDATSASTTTSYIPTESAETTPHHKSNTLALGLGLGLGLPFGLLLVAALMFVVWGSRKRNQGREGDSSSMIFTQPNMVEG